jgi:tetratricopeptide (TPR) repeat protein
MQGSRRRNECLGRFVTILLVLGVTGCPQALSLEEARQAATTFGTSAFVPPPRPVDDMVSALDAEVARLRRQVSPKRFEIRLPDGADRETQVQAFATEGIAARQMGRSREALENLRAAKDRLVLGSAQHDAALAILRYAAETEAAVGNYDRAIADDQRTIAQANTPAQRDRLFQFHASLSDIHLTTGDLRGAERSLTELKSVYSESKRWQGLWPLRWPITKRALRASKR